MVESYRLKVCVLFNLILVVGTANAQFAQSLRIRDICRIKGQEENTLQGLGLVVGLNGTGDGGNFMPAIRSLATAMQLMGNPIGKGGWDPVP